MQATRFAVMKPGDEARLEGFLQRMPEITMLLRSNLRNLGLRDEGRTLQGTWVASLDDDDAIVGVAAHFHTGTVVLAAPVDAGSVAAQCVAASGRPVAGLLGPWCEVQRAREAMGLHATQARFDSPEVLFALELHDLKAPAPLRDGALVCRRAPFADRNLLAQWRTAYHIEALGAPESSETRSTAAAEIERAIEAGDLYVLSAAGQLVSCCSINARLPDIVGVSGVWTPPELRCRGYGRAAVAASLLSERAMGAARAVLFTEAHNPARRAYEAIGFRAVGDYGLVLW
jgi:RimJ/RimL family protein N-acetyltransferase